MEKKNKTCLFFSSTITVSLMWTNRIQSKTGSRFSFFSWSPVCRILCETARMLILHLYVALPVKLYLFGIVMISNSTHQETGKRPIMRFSIFFLVFLVQEEWNKKPNLKEPSVSVAVDDWRRPTKQVEMRCTKYTPPNFLLLLKSLEKSDI